jgi:hypothetical protein
MNIHLNNEGQECKTSYGRGRIVLEGVRLMESIKEGEYS